MIFSYLLYLTIFYTFLFSSLFYSLNIYFPSELNLLKFTIISIIVALIPVISIIQIKNKLFENYNYLKSCTKFPLKHTTFFITK